MSMQTLPNLTNVMEVGEKKYFFVYTDNNFDIKGSVNKIGIVTGSFSVGNYR
jgi:hypothetical protein